MDHSQACITACLPRQQQCLESDSEHDTFGQMLNECWATADRYISAPATPHATKSPRLALTAWGSTVTSDSDYPHNEGINSINS